MTPQDATETLDWRVRLSERVRLTTRTLGVGVWEWNLLSRTFDWDERTYELLGLPPTDEKLDLSFVFRCVHPQDRAAFAEALQDAAAGRGEMDVRFRVFAGGRPRHLHARGELIDYGRGQAARVVGTLHDVTASQKLSQDLGEERERLHVTLNSIGDAVIATDVAAAVTFLNPPAVALTGWTLEAAQGRALGEVLNVGSEGAGAAMLDAVRASLAPDAAGGVRQEGRLTDHEGRAREVELTASPIRTALGESLGAVLVLRDRTEARELQRRLEHAATHDVLTGLANRALFEQRLRALAEHGPERPRALCFIDVDRFKIINDSAGHHAGDMFLKALTEVLRPFVGEQETLARLGGDEFGLIAEGETAEVERRVGDMIRAAKDFRFAWNGRVYSAGISVGVSAVRPGLPPVETLGEADAACYAAKNAGRGRAVLFEPTGEAAERRQQIVVAADLRQVIDEDRLVLFGQEIVPLAAGPDAPRHFEILVRMLDSEHRLIGPGAFIPAAERFSIMDEVDQWILREAIQRLGRPIAQAGAMEISLNLSANSLDNPFLLDFVTQLLEESPLAPSALTFEITESAALSHVNAASRVMRDLKALGCRVALDDFGVGSSSLSYLKHFPADVVKLDGSFISNMLTSKVDFAIVKSVNDLAHTLGAKTVAEFVEDEATLEAVRSIGVDYVQGYIHGAPRPLEQILREFGARAAGRAFTAA